MLHLKKKIATQQPSVIDLFSGVGGFSLGAARAGFHVAAAIDNDELASSTHLVNFPRTKHGSQSVRSVDGASLLALAGLRRGHLEGLIGGPPCQGFSVMGHRKASDRRNDLFFHFFRLVAEVKPRFFVAENVPGILLPRYTSVRERALDAVRDEYCLLEPFRIKASDFGAPTTRNRVFFVGFHKSMGKRFRDWVVPPSSVRVTVSEALDGLPRSISPQWQSEEQGWRRVKYASASPYIAKASGDVPEGVGSAMALERLGSCLVSGNLGTAHADDVIDRFRALSPGEKDPVSKGHRLDPRGFCPTIRAGTGSDRGSYQAVRPIHPTQPRVITPREAARLQGFPDWFVFHPTKWHSFRQIGNSVSPIVAETVLRHIAAEV